MGLDTERKRAPSTARAAAEQKGDPRGKGRKGAFFAIAIDHVGGCGGGSVDGADAKVADINRRSYTQLDEIGQGEVGHQGLTGRYVSAQLTAFPKQGRSKAGVPVKSKDVVELDAQAQRKTDSETSVFTDDTSDEEAEAKTEACELTRIFARRGLRGRGLIVGRRFLDRHRRRRMAWVLKGRLHFDYVLGLEGPRRKQKRQHRRAEQQKAKARCQCTGTDGSKHRALERRRNTLGVRSLPPTEAYLAMNARGA